MRALTSVMIVAALGVAPEAAALECTLARTVKVSVGGSWASWPAGTAVEVGERGPTWTTLSSSRGKGRAASGVVEAACPAIAVLVPEAPPPAAPPAEPTTVPPHIEAPVPPVSPLAPVPPAAQPPLSESAPPPSPARETSLVAVLDLKGSAGAEGTAQAVTTMLVANVGAIDGYKALSRNELQALLAHQADMSLLGCESVSCLANVGKLADAKLVIAGSVDKVDAAHVLSLTLLDPAAPAVLGRQEAAWRGPPEEMLALVRPLVDRLLAGPNAAAHEGALEVLAPDGALVIVDGREVGTAPLAAPVRGLPTGVHQVMVTQEGFLPFASDVVVARNETTIARVELEEIPFTQRAWFWLATGGAVLLAGGTAAGITTWAVLSQDKPARLVLAPQPK